MAYVPKNNMVESNGTSAVEVVGAPTTGIAHVITNVTAKNPDASGHTITLRINDGTDTWDIYSESVAAGAQMTPYTNRIVLDSANESLEAVLDGSPSSEFQITAHYAESS